MYQTPEPVQVQHWCALRDLLGRTQDWPQIVRHVIWSMCALMASYLASRLLHPSVSGMGDLNPIKIWIRTVRA